MVTDTTNPPTSNDLGHDEKFRENVRRQLLATGAEGTPDPTDTYMPMVQMDPSEGRAVRWFGSVIGSLLFLFGAFWFLALIGFTVPWYAVFPILAMLVGGFFITAAIATGMGQKKRKN
jgi:hypothetical protein